MPVRSSSREYRSQDLSRRTSRRAGVGRSFQITNLFGGLSVEENIRLAIQARSHMRYAMWRSTASLTDIQAETAELIRYLGLAGIEDRGSVVSFLWRPART